MSIEPARISVVSFDADGTLWDFQKVMRHSLGLCTIELRRLVPACAGLLTLETMIAVRNRVAEELRGKETNLEKIRLAAFKRTLQHIGVSDDALAAHLNALYLKHRFEDIRLFGDVLPTLDALQGPYALGLVSNGNSYPERCGLEGRFQFVVFSQDYGVEKPDPRLFEIAVEQAGCSRQEFLHVGDSLQNDVAGANRAGVRSVWLNRDRKRSDSDIQAEFEITSLTAWVDICKPFVVSEGQNYIHKISPQSAFYKESRNPGEDCDGLA